MRLLHALLILTIGTNPFIATLGGIMDISRLSVGQVNIGGMLALDVITNIFCNLNANQQWQVVAKGAIVIIAVAADALAWLRWKRSRRDARRVILVC